MKRPPMADIKALRNELLATWRFYDKADAWETAPIDKASFLAVLSMLDYVVNGAQYDIVNRLYQMVEVARDARENA
jgi:predicted ATPase